MRLRNRAPVGRPGFMVNTGVHNCLPPALTRTKFMIRNRHGKVILLLLLAMGVLTTEKTWAQLPDGAGSRQAPPQGVGSGDRVATWPQHGVNLQHQHVFPAPALSMAVAPVAVPVMPLTLDQAIGMALQNNTGIQLASANALAQQYATQVSRSDYFPKVNASAGFLHFNENLGKVVRFDAIGAAAELNVVRQDSTYAAVIVGQPITQLLTVNAAVQLTEADRRIAEAKLEGGRRDLAFAVVQLFVGLTARKSAGRGSASAGRGSTRR